MLHVTHRVYENGWLAKSYSAPSAPNGSNFQVFGKNSGSQMNVNCRSARIPDSNEVRECDKAG